MTAPDDEVMLTAEHTGGEGPLELSGSEAPAGDSAAGSVAGTGGDLGSTASGPPGSSAGDTAAGSVAVTGGETATGGDITVDSAVSGTGSAAAGSAARSADDPH
jgi:hypothetical protein